MCMCVCGWQVARAVLGEQRVPDRLEFALGRVQSLVHKIRAAKSTYAATGDTAALQALLREYGQVVA